MRLYLLTISILTIFLCLALSTTSCSTLGPKKEMPSFSTTGPKKELPLFLSIGSSISGLKDETDLVIIHIYNTDNTGMEEPKWNIAGNHSSFEIAIRDPIEGHVYTIIAEAEGYRVQPESYMIQIIGDNAYFVSNNETGEQALCLGFQFIPDNP